MLDGSAPPTWKRMPLAQAIAAFERVGRSEEAARYREALRKATGQPDQRSFQ